MKTMDGIISSIKDENLKKFAIGLQNKLEIAKNAILEKMKKGEKVTGAEKSALKTSTSAYAEKNRGKIPQRVAAGLAAVMLAGMLASCDGGLVAELFPPRTETSASEEETLPDEFVNNRKYDTLEVEDKVLNQISSESCGLGVLEVFNQKQIMTSVSVSNALTEEYAKIIEDPYNYDWDEHGFNCMGLNNISNPKQTRKNVVMLIESNHQEWTHKIVSTNYNFALESMDPDGNVYLTGFVNGRLENDLGLIDKDTIKVMKEVAKEYHYNDIVNTVRQEFFGAMYVLGGPNGQATLCYSVTVDGALFEEVSDIDRNYAMNSFTIIDESARNYIKMNFDYDVSENYFDVLLESGKVVDRETEAEIETEKPTFGTAGGDQDITEDEIGTDPIWGTAGGNNGETEENTEEGAEVEDVTEEPEEEIEIG